MEQEITKTPFRGFYGNYQHNLDAKGRAFITAKFKDGLDSGFMLAKGLDDCLVGYQHDKFHEMVNYLKEIPFTDLDGREFKRFFSGHAVDCEVDKQGRFSIPQNLRDYAGLTKDICFVGMIDHFEIWDAEKWRKASEHYDCNAEIQAEKMQKYLKPTGVREAV